MTQPSLALLAERVATLPSVLEEALAAPLPGDAIQRARLGAMRRFVITGGGLSEGPARVLVALLRRAGRDARFVSQSTFLRGGHAPPDPDAALVLFSQGLAPNARLPLVALGAGLPQHRAQPALGLGLLVTSVAPGDEGVARIVTRLVEAKHLVWTLPPAREDRLLLRVVGPAVALVAAIRIAELIAPGVVEDPRALAALPRTVEDRLRAPAEDLLVGSSGSTRPPIALVAEEPLFDLAMPLRWKLLEGLRVPDPPVWDPLQIAHGPLQSFYDEQQTLIALCAGPDAVRTRLFDRLRRVLRIDDGAHRLVELHATLPGPAALVELDAALDAALLVTLARHPMPLDDWPSRGLDGPIYDVDPETWAQTDEDA